MRQRDIAVFHDDLVNDMNITIGALQVWPNDSSFQVFPTNDGIIATIAHQVDKLEAWATSKHAHAITTLVIGQLDQLFNAKSGSYFEMPFQDRLGLKKLTCR